MANRFILNETSYLGPGSISVIPDEVATRGFKKAFVVTDKSLMQFKVATKGLKVLDDAKIAYAVFDDVKPNPTIENVQGCGSRFHYFHRRRQRYGYGQGCRNYYQ